MPEQAMPFDVTATVTGTASGFPIPKKVRVAMQPVAAAAARIRFDGNDIAKGNRHTVHEVARLYQRVPPLMLGQRLVLSVDAPAGLPDAQKAEVLAARIANLSAALAATHALLPEQYLVAAAEPPTA